MEEYGIGGLIINSEVIVEDMIKKFREPCIEFEDCIRLVSIKVIIRFEKLQEKYYLNLIYDYNRIVWKRVGNFIRFFKKHKKSCKYIVSYSDKPGLSDFRTRRVIHKTIKLPESELLDLLAYYVHYVNLDTFTFSGDTIEKIIITKFKKHKGISERLKFL